MFYNSEFNHVGGLDSLGRTPGVPVGGNSLQDLPSIGKEMNKLHQSNFYHMEQSSLGQAPGIVDSAARSPDP
jgi:hypothetical protein